jgi:hypothetical protein
MIKAMSTSVIVMAIIYIVYFSIFGTKQEAVALYNHLSSSSTSTSQED